MSLKDGFNNLAFDNLISTTLAFNNPCIQQCICQQHMDLTILGFNNPWIRFFYYLIGVYALNVQCLHRTWFIHKSGCTQILSPPNIALKTSCLFILKLITTKFYPFYNTCCTTPQSIYFYVFSFKSNLVCLL